MAASLLWLAFCATTVLVYGQSRSEQHIVLMEAVAFSPKTIEAKVGDTVVWKNRDPFPHNVSADNGRFHTDDVAPEQTGKITVDKQGRFPLCMYTASRNDRRGECEVTLYGYSVGNKDSGLSLVWFITDAVLLF